MRLTEPEITKGVATVRSTARLVTAEHDIAVWYEAPADWQIDRTCAPFVPIATAFATAFGEPDLDVDGPIPATLLSGARRAAEPIATHFGRRTVQIEAETRPAPAVRSAGRHVGLFLSRGVDSSANLVLGDQGRLDPRPDLAIIVADIDPANSPDLEARLVADSVAAAASFGLASVVVSSNMRDVIDQHLRWIETFGPVLAGVGLLLASRLSDAIISSAVPDQRFYTGAHPDIDPLWSNGAVSFHHLPRELERSERVQLIVEDGRPLEFLRVCWSGGYKNCGRCRKCKQTLTLIAAFGGDPSGLFADTDVSPEDIRRDGPGYILRPDYIMAAPPELAAAAAERLEAVEPRDAPIGLRGALGAAANGRSGWLVVGHPGPETAALVEAALDHGTGTVLAEDDTLTTHVLRRAASHAAVTMWPSVDPATDGLRALACLRSGSRPLIVHPPSTRDEARARLPGPAQDLAGSIADVGNALNTAAEDVPRLARLLVGGAIGWVQS